MLSTIFFFKYTILAKHFKGVLPLWFKTKYMIYRTLSRTGEKISAIGLGCMGMSFAYGPVDDQESIATLHRALDLGINFWDTADMYANGKNEELISQVLVSNRDKVFIATKFGFRLRDGIAGPSHAPSTYVDGSPQWIRQAVEGSLKRLGIETIDLYYAHRIDPNIPVEETVSAMAQLVKEGKVRWLGLSEASAKTIRRAHAVHPITALQSEYSLLSRDLENGTLQTVRELGISLVAYSPLSRGLITATLPNQSALAADDFRRTLPRFDDQHMANNRALAEDFSLLAKSKNCTAAQLALAWVLAQGEDIIPIPGTKKRKYLEENAGAVDILLTAQDMQTIDQLVKKYPDTGQRYSERSLQMVDR
jgi:aryl-alcohol dehydrogenase-like predicted oxidoreductase